MDNILQFIELVREMRTIQKEYYEVIENEPIKNLHEKAKELYSKKSQLEEKVDNMLTDEGKEATNG